MPKTLSIAMIAMNEEANLPRTLESVRWAMRLSLSIRVEGPHHRIAQAFGQD